MIRQAIPGVAGENESGADGGDEGAGDCRCAEESVDCDGAGRGAVGCDREFLDRVESGTSGVGVEPKSERM